jgi:exonuclease III
LGQQTRKGLAAFGPKFNYKLAWFERLIAHAAELMASGAPVVLAGDYNVVPTRFLILSES